MQTQQPPEERDSHEPEDLRVWHPPKLTVLDVGDDTDGKNPSASEFGSSGPS
jgi:hypothetical protein